MRSSAHSHWSIAAAYQFTKVPDPPEVARRLRDWAADRHLCGTLILAPEGFNGTLSGEDRSVLENLFEALADWLELPQPPLIKWSAFHRAPFGSFRVKVKPEIVTFRQERADPKQAVGTYVRPAEWNQLIQREEVLTIDTRNDYEVAVGRFKGAIQPETTNFTEFARFVREQLEDQKSRPVAMYCTGGIRCEKATAFLLQEGFKEVYHLEGGILHYLEEMDPSNSLWEGECFVFDDRVAVDHQLGPSNEWKMDHRTGIPYRETEPAPPNL